MDEAHSTRARWRPEYSRTIASWIIVSSRCVAGLSTGSRPVSASITMKNAAKASRCAGLIARSGSAETRSTMPPRFVVFARSASAKTARMTVGSARAATATSRLLPMPPNALPASSPASARKNVPSRKSDMSRMIPAKASGGREVRTGAASAATSIAPASTYGVARKIQDVVSETTGVLPSSLRRSRNGCHGGGPRRPTIRALSVRSVPTSSGAPSATATPCSRPRSSASITPAGAAPAAPPARRPDRGWGCPTARRRRGARRRAARARAADTATRRR